MTNEGKLLLLTLAPDADTDRKAEVTRLLQEGAFDWQRYHDILTYHEFTGLSYGLLRDVAEVPASFLELLKSHYYYIIQRCEILWHEFIRLHDAFTVKQIPLVPLKGIAFLADIYRQQPLRPMADIDLLVAEDDIRHAEEILVASGYRKDLEGLTETYWRQHQYHLVFCKTDGAVGCRVELHWALDYKRGASGLLPALWQRVQEIPVEGRRILTLSPEDTFFALALHNRRFGKTLCLKNAYDLVLMSQKYRASFDWEYVVAESKRCQLCASAFFMLTQARMLGLEIPAGIMKRLGVWFWQRRAIRTFIEKNTFTPPSQDKAHALFLKSHFLLYDTLWEPFRYILTIPQEQMAKFYGLRPYANETEFIARHKLWYIPYKSIGTLCAHVLRK